MIESFFSKALLKMTLKETVTAFVFDFIAVRECVFGKIQIFTLNDCFGRLIKVVFIEDVSMNYKKHQIIDMSCRSKIWGRVKQ